MAKMKIPLALAAAAVAAVLSGCAYQRVQSLPPAGLPEEVYMLPQTGRFYAGAYRAALLPLSSPDYAPGAGNAAAVHLFNALSRSQVFADLTFETKAADMDEAAAFSFAKQHDYDLLILGEVLYYFDGSSFQPARVDEQVRVMEVTDDGLIIRWHAKASEIILPKESRDDIFVISHGAPAPEADILMRRNAEKFRNMLVQSMR